MTQNFIAKRNIDSSLSPQRASPSLSARFPKKAKETENNDAKISGQPEMSQNQGLGIFERSGSEKSMDQF